MRTHSSRITVSVFNVAITLPLPPTHHKPTNLNGISTDSRVSSSFRAKPVQLLELVGGVCSGDNVWMIYPDSGVCMQD